MAIIGPCPYVHLCPQPSCCSRKNGRGWWGATLSGKACFPNQSVNQLINQLINELINNQPINQSTRYSLLSYCMCMRTVSFRVKKRFPDLQVFPISSIVPHPCLVQLLTIAFHLYRYSYSYISVAIVNAPPPSPAPRWRRVDEGRWTESASGPRHQGF